MIDCEVRKILTPTKLLYIIRIYLSLESADRCYYYSYCAQERGSMKEDFFFDRTVRATYRCKMD